jgi:xanthine dehydrogenase YagS FAD-binding subunit
MAVIRDMMPAFELFQPTSIDDAVQLLDRHGSSAWVMAGGLDTFDWLKDRTKRPSVVVDLSQVRSCAGSRRSTAASRSARRRR